MQHDGDIGYIFPTPEQSQSLCGAKWFATSYDDVFGFVVNEESQSPYGAKWFATQAYPVHLLAVPFQVAIPLRG